jgi:hypothetical protein
MDECNAGMRLAHDHLCVPMHASASAVTRPVGRVALYRAPNLDSPIIRHLVGTFLTITMDDN